MDTIWGECLPHEVPLSEYPRPQLRRDSCLILNGIWQYAIQNGSERPEKFDGTILVPFSPEAKLSGVERQLQRGKTLWYERTFDIPEDFNKGRLLLHFGAVDQVADVFINGTKVCHHEGGYLPFTADITKFTEKTGNVLSVRVTDDTNFSIHAYGKQKYERGGTWHTAQSGIWQTVWLESVPERYIKSIKVTPNCDNSTVRIKVTTEGTGAARVTVYDKGIEVAAGETDETTFCLLKMENFRFWSPENPYLYDLQITYGEDRVDSYFAMRKFGTAERNGKFVITLNNEPYFMNGLLDQGYWSDGLYTAPSDEAMLYDIRTAKDLGFNTLRKHIKLEPLRWYYHCDRIGMIVWQDMVSGGRFNPATMQVLPSAGIPMIDKLFIAFTKREKLRRDQFICDCQAAVNHLYNCVCIAMWAPFHEGRGQFDSLQVTQMIWDMDVTRLVDIASGWHDQLGGDLKSRHVYKKPIKIRADGMRALALTEFGGYSYEEKDHTWGKQIFGYKIFDSKEQFMDAYAQLYETEVQPLIEKEGLSAAIYTQLSDVEDEKDGLLTYDRQTVKVDAERVRQINQTMCFPEKE